MLNTTPGMSPIPERNVLIAVILLELEKVLGEFSLNGFAGLRAEWQGYHAMQNQPVQVLMPNGSKVEGVVRGVANDGALELETMQEIKRFNVGEVSLRSVKHAID